MNGKDVLVGRSDTWIIDFGIDMPESEAAFFELPFAHVHACGEAGARRQCDASLSGAAGGCMREPAPACARRSPPCLGCIATPRVAKHRLFAWLRCQWSSTDQLVVIARADDASFGLLHSRFHELWSLRMCTWMGVGNDPRYTPTTCFETFPFPAGLTPADTAHQRTEALPDGALIPADLPPAVRAHAEAIARAAKRLVDLRDAWLNPPEWTERVPEVVPLGMDALAVPRPHRRQARLRERTCQAHADQPLQPAPGLARAGPRGARRRRGRRLRLEPTTRRPCPTTRSCAGCWP